MIVDLGGIVSNLLITPISRFSQVEAQAEILEQFINLTIITQNQGLIAMPSQNDSFVRISYSGDSDNETLNPLNNVYMQEIVDGYNLTYDYSCSYFDEEGELKDCRLDGIDDLTGNTPYTFFIEQVTTSNRVTHSFTMNRLFFMLDSKKNINILALQNNDLNLNDINF